MSTWETPSDQPGDQFAAGDDRFEWIDGQGRRWTIVADAAGVSLQCQYERIEIPRERFVADLYVSPMGEQVVVRFADADQEVGFLVPRSAADALLGRLKHHATTPDQRLAEELRAAPAIRPDWPEMTAVSIWALLCALLAFLPFVGIGFAAVAGVLIVRQRARTRRSAATLHIRIMTPISTGLLLWGLAVWALSTWTWYQPLAVERITSMPRGALGEYTWATRILGWMVIVVSLSFHEAGHAISAWWCGDNHARSLGRVTLNPKAHIDPFGTVLLPLILTLSKAPFFFGYAKPVPVHLGGIRRFRRAHILISIAGPGANLMLAALSFSMLLAIGCVLRHYAPGQALAAFLSGSPGVQLDGFIGARSLAVVMTGLRLTFQINVFLAAFNLIPVPPLDGSWVLEHLFPQTLGPFYARIRPFGFMIFLLLLFTGALEPLLMPAFFVMAQGQRLLWHVLFL